MSPETNDRPCFLVLRGGAIGDFVLTLPVLQALRERWPASHVTVVGYPHITSIGERGGLVDTTRSFEGAEWARLFVPGATLSKEQQAYIRSFDVVITYLYDPDGLVVANLLAAGAQQVIYGSPIVEEGHAADHLLQPLSQLALFPEKAVPELRLADEYVERGRAFLRDRGLEDAVAIHAGSGSPSKNWPLARYLELSRALAGEYGIPSVFTLGEADDAVARGLAEVAPTMPTVSGLSLADLAGVLAACRAYVGNDSGITHLAAALGRPVTALFGSTDSDRWGPRGDRARVLKAPHGMLERVRVADALACVAACCR